MYLLTKNLFKNILIILFSLMMAFSLLFTSACANDDDDDNPTDGDDTETEETIQDYQVIKNGDFEFSTNDETTYPCYSSISWSRTTDTGNTSSATSSKTSGIIDTSDTAYAKLDQTALPKVDNQVVNPKTPNYYGLTKENYDYEDSDTRVNPQSNGSKIYMLVNKSSKNGILGTAQNVKAASSITIPVDGYAVVSLWLNTYELKSNYTNNPGAYISLAIKVGSTTYDSIYYSGINTNGEWAQFNLYIKGSDLGTTTITPSFGLGRGNGASHSGYVEGWLFVDDVYAKVYDKFADYNEVANGDIVDVNKGDISATNNNLVAPTSYLDNGEKADYNQESPKSFTKSSYQLNFKYSLAKEGAVITNRIFTSSGYNDNVKAGYDKETGNTLYKGSTLEALKADATNYNIVKDAISDDDISAMGLQNSDSVSFINFANPSTAYLLSDAIELKTNTYQFITFYAKVKTEHFGAKKATVSIVEKNTKDETTAIFSSFTNNDLDGAYNGWQKYSIILYNPTATSTNYQIKLVFGDDETALIESAYALQKGYAIVAGLKTFETTEEIYNSISTSENVNKTILYGNYMNFSSGSSSSSSLETYNVSTDLQGSFEITNKPTTTVAGFNPIGDVIGDTSGVKKGIINSKYSSAYTGIENLDKFATLTSGTNKYAQTIVISNSKKANSGYATNSNTIPADGLAKISLNIKVFGDAVANVYVVASEIDGAPIALKIGDDYNNEIKTTITKNSYSSTPDGWVNLTFYVAAGNKDINFKVEVWNGAREENSEGSQGSVFFELVKVDTTIMQDAYDTAMLDFKEEFSIKQGFEFTGEKTHTRPNLTTITLDDDGHDVETITRFEPKVVYAGNEVVKFYDFTTVDATTEIDNREESSDSDEDTSTDEDENIGYEVTTDLALQISSIIIAIVLIIVMIVVLVRKNTKSRAKMAMKRQQNYGGVSSRNQRELANERGKALKKVIVDDDDDDEDYDYEEAQAVEEENTIPEEIVIDEEVDELETNEKVDDNENGDAE